MMKMNKIALATGAVILGISSLAQADFSGNVALTSDYVFRGISQNDNDMAIQGGFDYNHESGFYAGVWGSNVDDAFYNGSSLELDIYAGWSGDVGPVSVDAGALRYNYPGQTASPDVDTNEFHVGVSKDFEVLEAGITFNYSPDFFNLGSGKYYDLSLSAPVGPVTIAAHYGKTVIDENSATPTDQDYADYSLGLSTEYAGFGFDLTYTNTDGDGMCKGVTLCDSGVALTVSRSF